MKWKLTFTESFYFQNKYYDCGGALISNQWVLTSAQCLRKALGGTVHLGLLNLKDTKEDGREIFNVTKKDFHLYPTYEKQNPFTK